MTRLSIRGLGARRSLWALAAVAVSLGTSVGTARASNGLFDFFQQLGGGAPQPEQALPQPDYAEPSAPPLTVRRHHHRRPVARIAPSPRDTLADLKNVTIYTDKTLVPGDAVMTKGGMRVFAGSQSWPYRDEDFVALSSAPRVSPALRKELKAMDVASRIDLR